MVQRHTLPSRRGVSSAGFAHQIGEMILQTGGRMPWARAAKVSRTERRIAPNGASRCETAEDIAGTESDEQTIDLRQHTWREERDGNGIVRFKS